MSRCQRCFGELSEFAVFCPHCSQVHEPDLSLLLNQTVGGRYKLYRRLGQGGLSTVFAATDLQTDSVVVVKVSDPAQLVKRELTYAIDAEAARNYWQEMLERMRREAEVLADIDHPNIVRFFDTGTIGDDLRFVAMEFLRGRMLREDLDAQGKLETTEAANIVLQLCDALGEVHALGIVHRDINPRNVMLGDDGGKEGQREGETERPHDGRLPSIPQSLNPSFFQAKLIDFGIAKFPQPTGAPPFTQHSVLSGTVAYASPEQCQSRSVDQRSDIYSLGVMLYEMLTGERPFKGRTPTEIAINHLQAEPRPPRQLNSEIPANLEKVILRALAKSPEDRQQSIQEFADDVRSAARQVVIPLTPEALPDVLSEEEIAAMNRLALIRRRRRRVAVAAAVVLLAMLAGAIWGRNWLASRTLPLLAAVQSSPTPTPSPEGAVASDLDSLELAAQLPGYSASGGSVAKTATPPSVSQQPQSSGTQSAASTSGNAKPNNSAKSSSASIVTPPANQASKSSQQVLPTPPPVIAANRTPQTTQAPVQAAPPPKQPEITQASKQAEDRKIRQRDADTSAKPAEDNSYHEIPTARRDRIASNRDRDEGTLRRDSRDDADGNERETASRQDPDQVGPKLIQWSGRVNGEREVLIDLPGTPGTLEIPRVYRNRVAVIEPPSASNRWRSVRLRVFGEGGVSFVVRWWPMNQFTKVAERR